jgi:hypothetical protein
MNFKSPKSDNPKLRVLMKTKPQPKEKKLLLNLMSGERQRHRVALVTEEGEWNQHEPNSGMARMSFSSVASFFMITWATMKRRNRPSRRRRVR